MFDDDELRRLREHQLAVFRGKIIYEAQPPVEDGQLAEIERRIGVPVPEGLVALWRVAFGGSLDYALSVEFGPHVYTASFRELFYPDSDGYRDLYGWIEHEQELAEEAAEEAEEDPPGCLHYLPFGGFEYLERLYVVTDGPQAGAIEIWAQGLPPAWKGRLTEDSAATIANDVAALFDRLELMSNPLSDDADPDEPGVQMCEAIAALGEEHPKLADRLRALVRASVFDWRGEVESRTFGDEPRQWTAGRIAWCAAAEGDDLALVDLLLGQGYPTTREVQGRATPLVYALSRGASQMARRLLNSGRPMGEGVAVYARGVDQELARMLVDASIPLDVDFPLAVASEGAVEAAALLAAEGHRSGDWSDLRKRAVERAARERQTASSVEAGTMGSYATPERHREMAADLVALAQRL